MSLIWDIVLSVDRRTVVPLSQHRASICSHRELIFSAGSETLSQQDKQQHRSDSGVDAAGCKVQTCLTTDADTVEIGSDISHLQNIVAADEDKKQKMDELEKLKRATNGNEKSAVQQHSTSIKMNAASETQATPKSSKAGKQSGKNRNAKKSVQMQSVIAADNIVTSSGTTAENASASDGTDESIVACSAASQDVVNDG